MHVWIIFFFLLFWINVISVISSLSHKMYTSWLRVGVWCWSQTKQLLTNCAKVLYRASGKARGRKSELQARLRMRTCTVRCELNGNSACLHTSGTYCIYLWRPPRLVFFTPVSRFRTPLTVVYHVQHFDGLQSRMDLFANKNVSGTKLWPRC